MTGAQVARAEVGLGMGDHLSWRVNSVSREAR